MAKCRELLNKGLLQDIFREQMWVLSEIKEKVCYYKNLPLDKSHFITEVYKFFDYKHPVFSIFMSTSPVFRLHFHSFLRYMNFLEFYIRFFQNFPDVIRHFFRIPHKKP